MDASGANLKTEGAMKRTMYLMDTDNMTLLERAK